MRYQVSPGLFSLGSPTQEAPVFVTANYKLSFDHLRKGLGALNAWILVLDTKGINVWCAAGKGTFGVDELISRIDSEKLAEKVSHKNLIVPQLGAPGIAAHEVKKKTGFSVNLRPDPIKGHSNIYHSEQYHHTGNEDHYVYTTGACSPGPS